MGQGKERIDPENGDSMEIIENRPLADLRYARTEDQGLGAENSY
jgi:hypothetical protein